MKVEETSWFAAYDYDGHMHPCFKDNPHNVFLDYDDVKIALDKHMHEWQITDKQYVICKVTYYTTRDDTGKFIREEKITQTIDVYPAA